MNEFQEDVLSVASPELLPSIEPATSPFDHETAAGETAVEQEWDPQVRNRHLRKVCEGLTKLEHARHSRSERKNGHGDNSAALKQQRKVGKLLTKACGACDLRPNCGLADDIIAWHDVHRIEKRGLNNAIVQETREDVQRRLKTDPKAPCILPQTA